MNGPITDHMRISDNFLVKPLNITRTLRFFWDLGLTLFDIPRDVAFAEFLYFCNILVFGR